MRSPTRPGWLVREFRPEDRAEWARMRTALWPDQTSQDMDVWLTRPDTLVIVTEREAGGLAGFAEAGLRSYAAGCDRCPVLYLEGWWVDPDARRHGIGRALVAAIEAWARARGFSELASDALLDNLISHAAHRGLGFAEVERVVLFRKVLLP